MTCFPLCLYFLIQVGMDSTTRVTDYPGNTVEAGLSQFKACLDYFPLVFRLKGTGSGW